MQEVLSRDRVLRPCRSSETAHPVVGGRTIRLRIRPHVPAPLARSQRRPRVTEPRMPVTRVVGHQVHEHPDTPLARFVDEAVEFGHRAELRVDAAVVGYVVSPVRIGRDRDRAQPDRTDAQPLEVVEMLDHALQIPCTVPVGVGERTHVYLVEDGGLPPRQLGSGRRRRPRHLRNPPVSRTPLTRKRSPFLRDHPATSLRPRGGFGILQATDSPESPVMARHRHPFNRRPPAPGTSRSTQGSHRASRSR